MRSLCIEALDNVRFAPTTPRIESAGPDKEQKIMAAPRDEVFARQVIERTDAILDGRLRPEDATGATSVRCAVGLVLGKLDGLTTLSTGEALEFLAEHNRQLVFELRTEYASRVDTWRKLARPL